MESSTIGSTSCRRFFQGGRWVSTWSVAMLGRQDSRRASPAGRAATVTMSYFLKLADASGRLRKLMG
jgi:hypothetical protein